jgi:hypothetical protein
MVSTRRRPPAIPIAPLDGCEFRENPTSRSLGHRVCCHRLMSWLLLLGLAALVAAVAAVTGIKPKETRPVAHTRMMWMARFVLGVVAIFLVYLAFRQAG